MIQDLRERIRQVGLGQITADRCGIARQSRVAKWMKPNRPRSPEAGQPIELSCSHRARAASAWADRLFGTDGPAPRPRGGCRARGRSLDRSIALPRALWRSLDSRAIAFFGRWPGARSPRPACPAASSRGYDRPRQISTAIGLLPSATALRSSFLWPQCRGRPARRRPASDRGRGACARQHHVEQQAMVGQRLGVARPVGTVVHRVAQGPAIRRRSGQGCSRRYLKRVPDASA